MRPHRSIHDIPKDLVCGGYGDEVSKGCGRYRNEVCRDRVRMEKEPGCSFDVACGNGAEEDVVDMGLIGVVVNTEIEDL